jgi:hypothetical protein
MSMTKFPNHVLQETPGRQFPEVQEGVNELAHAGRLPKAWQFG